MMKNMVAAGAPQWAWDAILGLVRETIVEGTREDLDSLTRAEDAVKFDDYSCEQDTTDEEYVFVMMDDGQCKKVIVDSDLKRLAGMARSAIEGYLASNGHGDENQEELATEDGYAKIVRVTPGVSDDTEEDVWTYSFDGEVSLNYAFKDLIS